MRGLVKEAMRLYPVAPFLTRITVEETEIGQLITADKFQLECMGDSPQFTTRKIRYRR